MTENNDSRRLRFAVMCSSAVMQQWQKQALDALLSSGCAEPVLLIMPSGSNIKPGKKFWQKITAYPWRKIIFRKYYQYLFRPQAFRKTIADFGSAEIPVIRCTTLLKKKYSEYFSPEDVETIRSYQPDFILKFAFGIIRGEILNCAPYGVWSFHHGDEQKYRGVPPAFHEILYNDAVTASILQRLTETLDGGVILRKGYFPTICHSWRANLDQAIALSVNWPADVCREIIAQHTFPTSGESTSTTAPVYKEPENTTMLQFLAKQLYNKIKFHFSGLFQAEQWSTGIIRARTAEVAGNIDYSPDPEMVSWLHAGSNDRYFADGFALRVRHRILLLFEDYSYRHRKGRISAAWYNERDHDFSDIACALEEPWHLSYPFIFKEKDEYYCLPESKDHGSVELYRLDTDSMKLTFIRSLLPGVAAADPTLVFHQNRWFLFFTPAHATNVELHIWHSPGLDQPFEPHELNPVKADIRNARPAGSLFRLDDKLYRPAQDCSRTYGGRVVINEIKILSEEAFLEMPVSILKPPPGYKGIHNLSFAGDYMYFDCKKFVFSPASFLYQAGRRFRSKKHISTGIEQL